MQKKTDGKKRQGELDPLYKQGSLNRSSDNSIGPLENGQAAEDKGRVVMNYKVMAAIILLAFLTGMLVLLIIQKVNSHKDQESAGSPTLPQMGSSAAEESETAAAEEESETAALEKENETVSADLGKTASASAAEFADDGNPDELISLTLPGGSKIDVPAQAQQLSQLSFETRSLSAEGSGEGYVSDFYVGDRSDPVFSIQEGGGPAPEGGLDLPGNAWLIPFYKTYNEDERVAFDTNDTSSTEDDEYNIFDSCWFYFCRNDENIFFRTKDGQEISLDQVMYSAEFRSSRYADNPLIYFIDDYNFKLTFPQSIAYIFSPDESKDHSYFWFDYPLAEGQCFQLGMGGMGLMYGSITIQAGPAGADGNDSWVPSPVYEDENCYLKIMVDSMETLKENHDEDSYFMFDEFEIILNEAFLTLPDGSRHMLSEYAD